MGKFDGILICTDLDGTLYNNQKQVSKENSDAIAYFKREGGLFTFVTGRMPYYALDAYEAAKPNCPIGCVNGGGIYDYEKKSYLWTKPLKQDVVELLEYAEEQVPEIGICVTTFDKNYFSRENQAIAYFREITNQPDYRIDYRDVTEPIAKILFGGIYEESLQKLEACLHVHPRADEFAFVRSEKYLYEILPKGMHKGIVIEKLVEILGLDIKKTVAIGDYNNDIGMIKTAGVGVAVANAVPAVKEVADYITVSNEEHAIARVIQAIENGEFEM